MWEISPGLTPDCGPTRRLFWPGPRWVVVILRFSLDLTSVVITRPRGLRGVLGKRSPADMKQYPGWPGGTGGSGVGHRLGCRMKNGGKRGNC